MTLTIYTIRVDTKRPFQKRKREEEENTVDTWPVFPFLLFFPIPQT